MRNTFRFGRFELRADERVLLGDGAPLRLGGRAFDILLALVQRRERLVEFDELLDLVWPGLAVEENNLSVQISTLRKLIGEQAITTVRGRGYQFTAVVHELSSQTVDVAPLTVDSTRLSKRPRVRGAVLGFFAERQITSYPGWAAEGYEVRRTDTVLVLAFGRVRDGVQAALKAQRAMHGAQPTAVGRLGIVSADVGQGDAAALSHACERVLALARAAALYEIFVAAEIVGELVNGVDADAEDLGELADTAGWTRAYRLGPPAEFDQPFIPTFSEGDDAKPRIAVLPFEALVGVDHSDLLGDALADDVIACLSRNPHLTVVSSLSSRRLKSAGLTFATLAGCLAVHYVLSGSYRTSADGLVVDVLIQEVRRGVVLHSLTISRRGIREAFDPVDSIGQHVTRETERVIVKNVMERSRTASLPEMESYALLMAAIGLMHGTVARNFERARAMLDILAGRPGCAGLACAWLAKWHVLRVVQGWSLDPAVDSQQALDWVKRSLEDGSRDPLALSIGGLVHAYLMKDLSTAGWMYEEAIGINPSEPLAWLFSATRFAYLGQGQEASEAGERALSLSPLDPLKYFLDSLAATALLADQQWARSEELSRRSIRANRLHASSWRTMTYALVMLDRMDEARDAVYQLRLIDPDFTVGRFRERFPGRDGPMLEPWAEALKLAGLPV